MPRHGAAVLCPVAGALATSLPAGLLAWSLLAWSLLAWSLLACADGSRAPTAPARTGDIGEAVAVTAGDIGEDPIRALLLDVFFVGATSKVRESVDAAYTNLWLLKDGMEDCADARYLANLTLATLAANALGPTPGTADPETPGRVNALLAWLAPRCPAGVPASIPAAALSPNGLAVPVEPGQAYELTTRDGVLRLALKPNTFDRSVVLLVTRVAAGPGGGPFATTLPQYGPMFRLTTFPAARRTADGTFDFAAALVGDRVPPKAAAAHLLPIFGQTSPSGGPAILATIGPASRLLAGSPGYMSGGYPDGNLPKPLMSDSSQQSGSTSGAVPTLERNCVNSEDCNFYSYAGLPSAGLRALADVGTASLRGAGTSAPAAPLPFDLTLGLTRIYDPAVNGRAMLSATHVCGLRYTIANAGNVDLVAVYQPVDRNGAQVGAMWRTPVLVPAKGSRAVRITLPAGVSPSTVAAFHLMYGPTLVKAIRPGTTACP
jgi:hypothetical protein